MRSAVGVGVMDRVMNAPSAQLFEREPGHRRRGGIHERQLAVEIETENEAEDADAALRV